MSATFWIGASHVAYAIDQTTQPALVLPDLIPEALARNPELVAARKQWELATNRIVQARSLDDPTLSSPLVEFPADLQCHEGGQQYLRSLAELPFPGKLALKGEIARRSTEMTEQALRAKEQELVARLKQAYYEMFLAHKAIQIHHAQVELLQAVRRDCEREVPDWKGIAG